MEALQRHSQNTYAGHGVDHQIFNLVAGAGFLPSVKLEGFDGFIFNAIFQLHLRDFQQLAASIHHGICNLRSYVSFDDV